jgi:hypothetical protein
MARIDTSADPLSELTFEIERFEWTAADRLEVTGRWFGVRGQRFMRPTLHLRADGRRRRLIALLDHKPWAPDTAGLWTAAFAWRGDHTGITDPRLEVSTDIVLDLPTPGPGVSISPITPRPRPKREPRRPPTPRRTPPAPEPAAVAPTSPPATTEPPPAEPASPPSALVALVSPPAAPEPSDPIPSTVSDAPHLAAPSVPAHAPSSVTAEIAALALERRLVEERAEREALAHELAEARQRIEALSSHHESAVARAQEIVELEGQLAVANARADAAQAHVTKLERELARVRVADVAPVEVEPLPPRTPRRRGAQEWDLRTKVTAVAAVVVALIVVLIIFISVA